MNNSLLSFSIVIGGLLSVCGCEKKADTTGATNTTIGNNTGSTRTDSVPDTGIKTPAPDNTAVNKAERSGDTKTPLDQSQSMADIKITADIRRAILDDKNMSINAQNCKIITDKGGLVTLRGVVNTVAERDAIDAKARAVAGVTKVDNQLEVK